MESKIDKIDKRKNRLALILTIIIVIVILSVVIVPIMIDINNKSEKTAIDLAHEYENNIEKYCNEEQKKDPLFNLEDGNYIINNEGALLKEGNKYNIKSEYKMPSSGIIYIENQKILKGCMEIGEHALEYNDNELKDSMLEKCKNIYVPEPTKEECFRYEEIGDNKVAITDYLCGAISHMPNTHIYKYGENKVLDVVIPKTIIKGQNELTVTSIKNAFSYKGITSIIIPDSVTTIEDNAFAYNLIEELELQDSVTSIGENAFKHNLISNIKFNNNITSIGRSAFSENQLKNLELPSSITNIGLMAFSNNKIVDNEAFIYKRNPDGTEDKTTIIGYGGLNKSIEIPETVKTIKEYALSYNLLASVIIPKTVNVIEDNAFNNNPELIIKIEEQTKPENWSESWNIDNYVVKWNYKR